MFTIALYTIILHILHSLYEFARFVHNIYTYFVSVLSFENDGDHERLILELRSIKKKPHHLVFMLGNEEPSFKDLANIVLWSTAAGIPIISFYDHIGLLKQTISQFYKVLADKNIKFTSANIKHQNGHHKNGFSHPHPIEINVFTLQDGQNSVARVAKECVINNVRNDEVTIEYVDKQLKKQIGELPDPELALYCGRVCSTYGLLPWQIRLTEFIDVTSHHGICLSKFILALKRYEKSEQRYGK